MAEYVNAVSLSNRYGIKRTINVDADAAISLPANDVAARFRSRHFTQLVAAHPREISSASFSSIAKGNR